MIASVPQPLDLLVHGGEALATTAGFHQGVPLGLQRLALGLLGLLSSLRERASPGGYRNEWRLGPSDQQLLRERGRRQSRHLELSLAWRWRPWRPWQ